MIWIVIAAYNEEKKISQVIAGLKKSGYSNIVVVDDGSEDDTYEEIVKSGAVALRHFINRGQGAALQTGIDYALLNGADFIVTFDADGQHNPKDINPAIEKLRKSRRKVALGSRFLKRNNNTPLIRRLVLKAGVLVVWLFYGIMLTDSHNGFRVFTRDAAEKIDITSDRMEHASQIVEELKQKNISYIEVPVRIIYTDYSKAKGQSSMNSIKIGFKMILRKLMN